MQKEGDKPKTQNEHKLQPEEQRALTQCRTMLGSDWNPKARKGKGREGSGAYKIAAHAGEGGENGIEEGEGAGDIYRRVCGDVEKGGMAIARDDSRDLVLLGLSWARVCGFASLDL